MSEVLGVRVESRTFSSHTHTSSHIQNSVNDASRPDGMASVLHARKQTNRREKMSERAYYQLSIFSLLEFTTWTWFL